VHPQINKIKKRKQNNPSFKKVAAKKCHVSMFNDTDEYSSSSDQSSSKDSRPRAFRKKKSSIF
jgi:hypothetical protein